MIFEIKEFIENAPIYLQKLDRMSVNHEFSMEILFWISSDLFG